MAGFLPAFSRPLGNQTCVCPARNMRCRILSHHEKIIGIDLGTTNSAIAVLEGDRPEIIPTSDGGRTLPSVVAYTKDKDQLIGAIAKRQAVINPTNTFHGIKRFIGRRPSEVADDISRVPYKVRSDKDRVVMDCPAMEKSFQPEELSAVVLRQLADDARRYLGHAVRKAVITVPAYFNDAQRQATKDAGTISGLDVVRIINEPTAAALAYGVGNSSKNESVLVFDLGGGTFDVSILEIADGVYEVLSTSGDSYLGGEDFDAELVNYIAHEFKKEHNVDLRKDPQALQRLREAAEKAKIDLSSSTKIQISLPFITATAVGPKHIDMSLTRHDFEKLCSPLIDKCTGPIEQALADARLRAQNVDSVLLVGGSTRMPCVQELVQRVTGHIPKCNVNVDEVVALGAAVQAAVLAGDMENVLLLDVTPLSLGVETVGGVMTRIIPRNCTVPTRRTEVFSTATDDQTAVNINVYQGERSLVRDNRCLGAFQLSDLPPAPMGTPQVEVTFDIDENGILAVTARDKDTRKSAHVQISGATNLEDTEVQRLVQQAEEYAEEDNKRKHKVELVNECNAEVYEAEKLLGQKREQALAGQYASVEAAVSNLRSVLEGDGNTAGDVVKLQEALEKLKGAVSALLRKRHEGV